MNISRPDFYQSIYPNKDTLEDIAIGDLFDEVMALYNIVSDDYVSVNKVPSTDCLSKFLVQFNSVERAKKVYETLQGGETVIYDRHIQIICWHEGNDCVTISLHSIRNK